jgi:hypothetical protein
MAGARAGEKSRGPVGRTSPKRKPSGDDPPARDTGAIAREQFALTFADVLSGRFGGHWTVEWEAADRPASAPNGDRGAFSDQE